MDFFNNLPNDNRFIKITNNNFDNIFYSLKNLYANSELYKCLLDSDYEKNPAAIRYTKCGAKIIEELFYTFHANDPFVKFFQSSISTFHNRNFCSSKTAIIFTILLWKRLSIQCVENNLLFKKISKFISIVLSKIIEIVKINKLLDIPITKDLDIDSFYGQSNLKFSRRFSNNLKIQSKSNNFSQNKEIFRKIINGICRHQSKISELIYNLFLEHENYDKKFIYENISVIVMTKKTNQSELILDEFTYFIRQGLLLRLDENNFDILRKTSEIQYLNAILFDSSLVHNFTHIGFNKNLKYEEIYVVENGDVNLPKNYYTKWICDIKETLINNDIKILFIKDKCDPEIEQFLKINSILLFKNLSPKLIKQINETFQCKSLVYAEDFDQNHIFKCEINLIETDLNDLNNCYVNLFTKFNQKLFSVVIETRLQSKIEAISDYLDHCLKRAENIFNSGKYLKGNGDIELFLSNFINEKITMEPKNFKTNQDDEIYFNLTKEAFSHAFRDVYGVVFDKISNEDCYDDFQSKFNAWELACSINMTLMNTNFAIFT